jgi:hypothetical protein
VTGYSFNRLPVLTPALARMYQYLAFERARVWVWFLGATLMVSISV